MTGDRTWRFAAIVEMWSTALLIAAPVILVVATLVEISRGDGIGGNWLAVSLASTLVTGAGAYLLLRRDGAGPSSRLGLAETAPADLPSPAAAGQWRRWRTICVAIAAGGGSAMFLFLLAILGRGGLVEGAVVGIVAAVGLATGRDARAIRRIEDDEGRVFHSLGRNPTGAARRLIWTPGAGT